MSGQHQAEIYRLQEMVIKKNNRIIELQDILLKILQSETVEEVKKLAREGFADAP